MTNPANFTNQIRKIMANKLTVLVAGATGMLGTKIVSALLEKGDLNVRVMVRSLNDSKPENRQKIEVSIRKI
jgi:nucleoside-diphosphate-sugar epimerase